MQDMVTATAMIRKSVYNLVGGFDESIKGGMEDWEFWLKCADLGVSSSFLFSFKLYFRSPFCDMGNYYSRALRLVQEKEGRGGEMEQFCGERKRKFA